MSTLEPGSQFGNYHIVRHIGGGGMAQIYLAKTKGLAGFEKYLALKVINADYANENRFVQMLIDEAKITVKLAHANIAQVFDLGHVGGIYYIAMEYVDGIDVLRLVNGLHHAGTRLPIPAATFIAAQVCAGLHYAHCLIDIDGKALNLVHRDISPQNVLVSLNGEVKIVDFGIAKAAGLSSRTQAGVVKGKVNYMAPEQVLGHQADHRSDVFSTGIVLWEMLTSQMVYSSDKVSELINKVRKANIHAPSRVRHDVPLPLDDIVLKALASTPQSRYQSAQEFQTSLAQFLSATNSGYGAPQVAALVKEVRASDEGSPDAGAQRLSKRDKLPDHHSLIFDIDGDKTPRLVVQSINERQVIEIGDSLTIGRAADLVISDLRVSRCHARIFRNEDHYVVEDLNSSNGTFVNEEKITTPINLTNHDEVRIGHTRITFVAAPESVSPPVPDSELNIATRLLIRSGEQALTHLIEENAIPLGCSVQIGATSIQGIAANVLRQGAEIWLEPTSSRLAITVNDSPVSGPMRLNLGDRIQIGRLTCTLAN